MAVLYCPLAFVVFMYLYRELCTYLKHNYRGFSQWMRHVISKSLLSCLHAVLMCGFGLTISTQCTDVLNDRVWMSIPCAWLKCGFLFYNIWVEFDAFCWRLGLVPSWRSAHKFVHAHHLSLLTHTLLPVICLPLILHLRQDLGDFYLGCFFLTEAVMPFISLHAILVQMGLEHTRVYLINCFLLVIAWLGFRFLLMPYMFWKYARQLQVSIVELPGAMPAAFNGACASFFVLNIYRILQPCVASVLADDYSEEDEEDEYIYKPNNNAKFAEYRYAESKKEQTSWQPFKD